MGFKVVDTLSESDNQSIFEFADEITDKILDPHLSDLLSDADVYHGLAADPIALSKYKPRNRFTVGIEGCTDTAGPTTPYALYTHTRLDGCKATAYLDRMERQSSNEDMGSEGAPAIDLAYISSGYPIYVRETGSKAVDESGESGFEESVDLTALGLEDATVALMGFELKVDDQEEAKFEIVGVRLDPISVENGLFKFRISTWFKGESFWSKYPYHYNIRYAIVGLPKDTPMRRSCKLVAQDDFLAELLELSDMLGGQDKRYLERYLDDSPLFKMTQLNDIPAQGPGCLPFVPQGFRFKFPQAANIGWAQMQPIDLESLAGLDIYADNRQGPIVMYDLAREGWYTSTQTFSIYYSHIDKEAAGTCPIRQGLLPIGGASSFAFPTPHDKKADGRYPMFNDFIDQPFSQDVLIPKDWPWKPDGSDPSAFFEIRASDSIIPALLNGFAGNSAYCEDRRIY